MRFGIVGAGNIARTHAEAIGACDAAELAAVSGGSGAEDFAREWGVEHVTDPLALMRSGSVDAVSICTPSGSRRDYAVAAAKAGKHVLVEKPIEVTLDRAQAIVDACEDAGVTLGVIYQSRFKPDCASTHAAMANAALGRLVFADAYVKWHRPPEYYLSAPWRGTWELDGGGALINQAIHTVDLLLWFAGDVRRVNAWARNRLHEGIEVEDTLVAHLEFAQGADGVIEATTAVYPGSPRRIELHGTDGTITLVDDEVSTWETRTGSAAPDKRTGPASTGGASTHVVADARWHALQFEDFVEAVREGRRPAVDGREGMRSLRLVLALYESARMGTPVEVGQ